MIACKNLSLNFGKESILNNINLNISSGDFICITGKNGSGKTSLLMLLKGLYIASSGDIYIQNNKNRSISFISKNPNSFFMRLSLIENIEFFYNLITSKNKMSKDEVHELFEIFGLDKKMNYECSSLSTGDLQKLSILRGLIRNSQIMLFDECLTSVDAISKKKFISFYKDFLVRNPDKLTIWVTHNPNEIIDFDYRHYEIENKGIKEVLI